MVETTVTTRTTVTVKVEEKSMEGFDRAADMVDENSDKLKKSLEALKKDLSKLKIPQEHWEEGKEIKQDLRRLTVKIDSFVTEAKAGLNFALDSTKNKKIYEWMAGVEGSLQIIGNSIDELLILVSDNKAKVGSLR